MARIRKYIDGQRLIVSFEDLSEKDLNKIDQLINDLGIAPIDNKKIPSIKPLALNPPINKNHQYLNAINQSTINSPVKNKDNTKSPEVISDEQQDEKYEKPPFMSADAMTIYDLRNALKSLTGESRETLENIYQSKHFNSLDLYLDISSETELRNVYKECIA